MKNILRSIYYFVSGIFLRLFWIFPVKKNRIVFVSYCGKYYNDNPKAVSDELLESGENLEIVWFLKNINEIKDNRIKKIKYRSIKSIFYLATAGVWVDNYRKSSWVKKRKNQFYVQLWHGSLPIKAVEKDAEELLEKHYVKNAKNDAYNTDLMISGSDWTTELFRKSFYYNGKIIKCGTPRLDSFVKSAHKKDKEVFDKLNLDDSTRIILYAPTFRNNHSVDCYNIDFKKLVEFLSESTHKKWKVLIRLHPNMIEESSKLSYGDYSLDVTSYENLYDLIKVCDYFITDYSSTMFEAAIVKKRVLIYANDIDEYKHEREFYFELESLPFPICRNDSEIQSSIINFDALKYEKDVNDFMDKLGLCEEGVASSVVSNIIIENALGKKA